MVIFCLFLLQNQIFGANLNEFVEESEPNQQLCIKIIDESNIASEPKILQKSISFGGGSYFGVTYSLGVLDVLQKLFDLSSCAYLGDSSGSLTAASAALNIPVSHSIKHFVLPCITEKHNSPHCGFAQWGKIITKHMFNTIHAFNPELEGKAHKELSGKLHVSVSLVTPFLRNVLISDFDSDEDFADALMASCHLPWVLNGSFFTNLRGHTCIDGGLTNHNPMLNEKTIKINPFLWRSLFFWANHGCFTLHTEEEALFAIRLGYHDALKNLHYFIEKGLPLKHASIPLPISDHPVPDEPESSVSLFLRNKAHTFWFFSRNIFLSQANQYFTWFGYIFNQGRQSQYAYFALKILSVCMVFKYRKDIISRMIYRFDM